MVEFRSFHIVFCYIFCAATLFPRLFPVIFCENCSGSSRQLHSLPRCQNCTAESFAQEFRIASVLSLIWLILSSSICHHLNSLQSLLAVFFFVCLLYRPAVILVSLLCAILLCLSCFLFSLLSFQFSVPVNMCVCAMKYRHQRTRKKMLHTVN